MTAQIASGGLVAFCPLCSKPFTANTSSFSRHVEYCRRTGHRPKRRQKPCRACTAAKSKCSLQSPCSRCTAKGVECVYDVRSRHSETIRSSADQASLDDGSFDLPSRVDDQPISSNIGRVPDAGHDHSLRGPAQNPGNLAAAIHFEGMQVPNFTDLDSFDHQMESGYSAIWTEPPAADHSRGFIPDAPDLDTPSCMENNAAVIAPRLDAISGPQPAAPLSRLRPAGIVAQQTANIVIESLCAIPKQMLRRATFPGFIHPHWHLSELPEPLAICMRIAQMFSSRTVEITPFIWRTIRSEQRRFVERLPEMSKYELLCAIQAQMVFLTMRLVDGAAQSPDWNQEITAAEAVLCQRFLDMCGGKFCEPEYENPSLTWEDWIFAESRRRTSTVWFLVARTLAVKTISNCPTTEQPMTLPLPSPKLQWEARTREIWYEELEADNYTLCTFQDLIESRKRCDEKFYAQRLDAWNARTDKLGSLLSLAVSMV